MRDSVNLLMISLFCIAVSTVAVGEAIAKRADGSLSVSDAVKNVEKSVGEDIFSVDYLSTRKGESYYRITVDNTPSAERKDVFVDARTGKINQVIEHSGSSVGDDPAVR